MSLFKSGPSRSELRRIEAAAKQRELKRLRKQDKADQAELRFLTENSPEEAALRFHVDDEDDEEAFNDGFTSTGLFL